MVRAKRGDGAAAFTAAALFIGEFMDPLRIQERKKEAYERWLHAKHIGEQWEAIEALIKICIEEMKWSMG